MTCDICGSRSARVRKVTRSYGSGSDLLLVQRVPIVTCVKCGESYLTAATLHELERIKAHRRAIATKRPVSVANFAA